MTFQNFVNKTRLTQGMVNFYVIVYMDDILVYSESFHGHAQHIELTLGALQDGALKIALEKSELFLPEISFLGYVVTRGGMRPDLRKVAVVRDAATPTSLTQVRAFLGLASYYRRFIKGFAAIWGQNGVVADGYVCCGYGGMIRDAVVASAGNPVRVAAWIYSVGGGGSGVSGGVLCCSEGEGIDLQVGGGSGWKDFFFPASAFIEVAIALVVDSDCPPLTSFRLSEEGVTPAFGKAVEDVAIVDDLAADALLAADAVTTANEALAADDVAANDVAVNSVVANGLVANGLSADDVAEDDVAAYDIAANGLAANGTDKSSSEQAGDLSALVRKERRPKMLVDVVEKNFTPTKLKMAGMEPKEKFAYEVDARTDGIFQEFKTSRWLEYLEEFYNRETSPAFGFKWRIEEELEDKVGERKGASSDESGKGSGSGGGALGKGTRSSGGEHGKGSEPWGGASGKGLGPDVGASGKPISHGELQKHEMCQGRQATEGNASGPSGGAHDKGSGSPLD
ncbi:hypothetical protein CBR_g23307 [Chara braunii]|uniref:Reverse transcriptase domain-containing protein n=1 Tax=Chara braunii TaxID=69332 RepID=A0A388L3U5_CHABU|nr:hypothetical protein CBR_g23307 [Chara braunii]|eukprot:GBG76976.1 hypothetical protein CBR_g23307 [Chara braunii]